MVGKVMEQGGMGETQRLEGRKVVMVLIFVLILVETLVLDVVLVLVLFLQCVVVLVPIQDLVPVLDQGLVAGLELRA